MTRLLRGNHSNYISVQVDGKELQRVHRPFAMRLSRVWRKTLQDPSCREVHVTFPPDPPAAQLPPLLSVDQANKFALGFIVQWMETGGGDSEAETAVPYPRTRPGLQRLLDLAAILKVTPLVDRVNSDLITLAASPRKCGTCKRFE